MSMFARSYSLAVLVVASLATSACVSGGALRLGEITLKDGSVMEYIQAKTKGSSGPDVTVVEGFLTAPGTKSEKITSYSGSAPGMAEVIAGGLAGSVPLAGGMVGAAAVLRPSLTNISGVSKGGDATAFQLQGQGQGQLQLQGQGQSQGQGKGWVLPTDIK